MKEEGTGWVVFVSQDTVLYFIHITLSAKSSITACLSSAQWTLQPLSDYGCETRQVADFQRNPNRLQLLQLSVCSSVRRASN